MASLGEGERELGCYRGLADPAFAGEDLEAVRGCVCACECEGRTSTMCLTCEVDIVRCDELGRAVVCVDL